MLVTVDSLRYDAMPTPEPGTRLASLLDSAVTFSSAYATGPGTTPSFPALLTGTMPLSYGGLGPLTAERPRVSTSLAAAGLTTAGFQCNPFLSHYFNYDEGFDEFVDYQNPLMGIATRVFPRGIEINNPRLRRVDEYLHVTASIKKLYQLVKGKPRPYVSAEVITDDTLDWLDRVDGPFFCWTHYMDVHHPCYPPSAYRERYDVGGVTQSDVSEWYSDVLRDPARLTDEERHALTRLYRASVDYTFDQIERILQWLVDSGRHEQTLVVLTSDHGELFGEYGRYGKPERMYDELLHVPLVVANGLSSLHEAADDLVSLIDVPPLLHEALGLDVPSVYEGRVPGQGAPRDFIMAEHEVEGDVLVGARGVDWLYEADEIGGDHHLFDLRSGTPDRVALDNPNAASLRDVVLARLADLDVESRYLQGDLEADVEDRLADLGYL